MNITNRADTLRSGIEFCLSLTAESFSLPQMQALQGASYPQTKVSLSMLIRAGIVFTEDGETFSAPKSVLALIPLIEDDLGSDSAQTHLLLLTLKKLAEHSSAYTLTVDRDHILMLNKAGTLSLASGQITFTTRSISLARTVLALKQLSGFNRTPLPMEHIAMSKLAANTLEGIISVMPDSGLDLLGGAAAADNSPRVLTVRFTGSDEEPDLSSRRRDRHRCLIEEEEEEEYLLSDFDDDEQGGDNENNEEEKDGDSSSDEDDSYLSNMHYVCAALIYNHGRLKSPTPDFAPVISTALIPVDAKALLITMAPPPADIPITDSFRRMYKFEILESFLKAYSFPQKDKWEAKVREEADPLLKLDLLPPDLAVILTGARDEILSPDLTMENILEIKRMFSD